MTVADILEELQKEKEHLADEFLEDALRVGVSGCNVVDALLGVSRPAGFVQSVAEAMYELVLRGGEVIKKENAFKERVGLNEAEGRHKQLTEDLVAAYGPREAIQILEQGARASPASPHCEFSELTQFARRRRGDREALGGKTRPRAADSNHALDHRRLGPSRKGCGQVEHGLSCVLLRLRAFHRLNCGSRSTAGDKVQEYKAAKGGSEEESKRDEASTLKRRLRDAQAIEQLFLHSQTAEQYEKDRQHMKPYQKFLSRHHPALLGNSEVEMVQRMARGRTAAAGLNPILEESIGHLSLRQRDIYFGRRGGYSRW
ncbi:hypothetical protein DMC30DRAFT_396124 [Rhodotorula diobovata]|uniref:Uncharacterized protein n=1 Tax=Rhodotorula diobovata TaxID=5288 RepID=A0A5C5FVZ4_9BASI|nr:hypothetical protein DMC30DRAFT_396124 [Rhodotorula diobovata]